MKKISLLTFISLLFLAAQADEGMWILKELNKQSVAKMQDLGFTFPLDSIYSEQNASLKDAVVIFGGGCTGVAVSDQGLIFTNHHCGYDAIQKHSSVDHDYLKNGFVSENNNAELYTEGLTVSFLQKTEDVTKDVTRGITDQTTESDRNHIIDSLSTQILKPYNENPFIKAQIIPFYTGNKYYLVVYDVFKDVRMVLAPPSSIGKFGGDTDNWQWPRHTGDFSVFRVYANKDNKPANYSVDNIPYKPKYTVPITLKGYVEKDYAMTIGYPGSTERYLSSFGIKQMVESENIPRIKVRTAKQDIWKKAMDEDDAIRIKYAVKFSRSSNYWKNAIGMNQALSKLHVIDKKKQLENDMSNWISNNQLAYDQYSDVLRNLETAYTNSMDLVAIRTYFKETFHNGIEILKFASLIESYEISNKDSITSYLNKHLSDLYNDYEPTLDKQIMPVLLKIYKENVPASYLPDIYSLIDKKFNGDYDKYTNWVYDNSKFTDFNKLKDFLKKESNQNIKKDPAIQLVKSVDQIDNAITDSLSVFSSTIDEESRKYMAVLMQMEPTKTFSPDANFTQLLSYGSIKGYQPADAISYKYYTTTKGILEKENSTIPEFNLQSSITDSLQRQRWGKYSDKDGSLHVNFLSTNDITGGNSGSPVFNNKAELIGLAFDGNWEALSGDIVFEPNLQRTICVDIRYVLYVIDEIMNCKRLIEELDIKQ